MYNTRIEKMPASWAEIESPKFVNGHGNGQTNGLNGNHDGYANGHRDGRSNGHTESLLDSFLEGKSVRTVFGLVPLKYALDWPIFASYDELEGCAAWMGGRIPTFEEARSIYAHADVLKKEDPERQLGKTVPAVNG